MVPGTGLCRLDLKSPPGRQASVGTERRKGEEIKDAAGWRAGRGGRDIGRADLEGRKGTSFFEAEEKEEGDRRPGSWRAGRGSRRKAAGDDPLR